MLMTASDQPASVSTAGSVHTGAACYTGGERMPTVKGEVSVDRWQYQTVRFDLKGFLGGILDLDTFQATLNEMGAEGWELVSCFDTNMAEGQSRHVIAVFKRKIQ